MISTGDNFRIPADVYYAVNGGTCTATSNEYVMDTSGSESMFEGIGGPIYIYESKLQHRSREIKPIKKIKTYLNLGKKDRYQR